MLNTFLQKIGFVLTVLLLLAKVQAEDNRGQTLVQEPYRISEDRKKLDELRKDIPPETRSENDEKAFDLELLSNENRAPSEAKNKFDQALRRKREAFNRDRNRERDQYNKEEKKRRDKFLKELKSERDSFTKKKVSREERADFFKDQDEKRRQFFADEKDARQDFEQNVRAVRKDFEDYARARQNQFYQEWKAFSKKYDDNRRRKVEEERNGNVDQRPVPQKLEVE